MARHRLIEAYLAELAGRLPAGTVDELADGLLETWQRHLGRGLTPAAAAHAAIAEFGTPDEVTAAFVQQAAGRRAARALLATGPVVGGCWGASLITAEAWAWPVPAAAAAAFAVALGGVVGCLVAAAASRRSYRLTRLGDVGAAGLVVLDAALLTVVLAAVVLHSSAPVWPMAAAIPASLIRIAVTLRRLPRAT